jgi:hypothetical protein
MFVAPEAFTGDSVMPAERKTAFDYTISAQYGIILLFEKMGSSL